MSNQVKKIRTSRPPATPEGFIGKPEVALLLNKTVRTVDNWMARRIVPYYKMGRCVRFRWSEIEAHLQANHRVNSIPMAARRRRSATRRWVQFPDKQE
jgi:excisionase family DNA binding protein